MKCRIPNADFRMPRRLKRSRGGFSFTEILFAVMILGIGFIMVAAMFPVAIRQTEAGSQETIAAAVGRSSSNYLSQLASMPLPAGIYNGSNSASSTPLPSILLPTLVTANSAPPPQFTLPPASTFVLPVGQSTMVVPGQVWTMDDSRDPWVYTFASGSGTTTVNHNLFLWDSIARNLILPGDLRFGWAVMYRRDAVVRAGAAGNTIAPATFAQVIVIGMQCRIRQTYDPNQDLNVASATLPPTPFVPRMVGTLVTTNSSSGKGVAIRIPAFAGGQSYLDFSLVSTGTAPPPMLADNAYVVISDDNVPWGKPSHGSLNGRIFRVGAVPSAGTVVPLLPGSDLTASDLVALNNMQTDLGGAPLSAGSTTSAQFNVLIVGRTQTSNPSVNPPVYSGPAQDVTAYTTYLPIAN